jgi:hypothetical protein
LRRAGRHGGRHGRPGRHRGDHRLQLVVGDRRANDVLDARIRIPGLVTADHDDRTIGGSIGEARDHRDVDPHRSSADPLDAVDVLVGRDHGDAVTHVFAAAPAAIVAR